MSQSEKLVSDFLETDLIKYFENNPSQFVSDKIQIQLKNNPEKLLKLSNEIRQYYLKDGLIPPGITQNLLDVSILLWGFSYQEP